MRYPAPVAQFSNLPRFVRRFRAQPMVNRNSDKVDGRSDRTEPGSDEEEKGSRVTTAGDRRDDCTPPCQVYFKKGSKKISLVARERIVSDDRICLVGVSTPQAPAPA